MNRFISLLSVLLLIFTFNCNELKLRNKDVDYYKEELEKRLSQKTGVKMIIPEVEYSEMIHSNAQYDGYKIIIGKRFFSDTYFNDEDRLSILFHEYMHSLTKKFNIFRCKKDSIGGIFQIKTDIIYKKYLSEIEFQKDISVMRMTGISEQIIDQFKADAKKPVFQRFIYAPSNLSREELFCYYAELTAGMSGLFNQSKFYKSLIISRIESEMLQFKLRLKYEKELNMSSEGIDQQ